MEFFVPAQADPHASEQAYNAMLSGIEDATGWQIETGRIYSVVYLEGGVEKRAAVGSSFGSSHANAIFATDSAIIICRCTAESPCAPALLNKRDVLELEWFEGHLPLADLGVGAPDQDSSGTFFLFTDIEGSTRLWEDYPKHMRYALVLHDTIMINAVSANEGHVFNTGGDSFYCAFGSGEGAAKAAIDAQSAILGMEWPDPLDLKVRMVLHFGESLHWNDGYVGACLNHAANLLPHAEGGQVLVSADFVSNCVEGFASRFQLRHFGDLGLGKMCEPTAVFELVHPGLHRSTSLQHHHGLERAA